MTPPATGLRASRAPALALLLLLAPLLAAPKCIEYEPVVARDAGVVDAGPEAGAADAPADAPSVTPAVSCPEPGTARFVVRNLEYVIACGCVEALGKTCTVARGTTVHWIFADAVEHNVHALDDAFAPSTDRLSGQHSFTFEESGLYGYGCTLHPRAMTGYSVAVY